MSIIIRTPLITAAALILSGCAADAGRYPSLAVRDAERAAGTFRPAPPVDAAANYTPDPASLSGAVEQARMSHEGFLAGLPSALSLARSADGTGNASDVRARALIAIAAQTSLRGQTALALADLDQLEAQSAVQLGSLDEIRTARSYVEGLVSEQDAALDTLSQALSSRRLGQ